MYGKIVCAKVKKGVKHKNLQVEARDEKKAIRLRRLAIRTVALRSILSRNSVSKKGVKSGGRGCNKRSHCS